jgi:hypothetical protein
MQGNPNALPADQFRNFVRAGQTVTATIGRNVGSTPLSDEGWDDFKRETADHLGALLKPSLTFTYEGSGEWDGVAEDSAIIVLVATQYTTDLVNVRAVLADLCKRYEQDAIALTYGNGELVSA